MKHSFRYLGMVIPVFITVLFLSSCEKGQVNSITLDSSFRQLLLGQLDSISVNMNYSGDVKPKITWTSDKPEVVKVTDGEIEGLSKGTAVITAKAGNQSASCTVVVDNQIKPSLEKGELWFFGDYYMVGANDFIVCISDKNIDLTDLSGGGEFMYLEFNADTTYTDSIPNGLYQINNNYSVGTMVPAWVDDDGKPWGTWYFGKSYNQVVAGSASVSVANNVYHIVYDFTDYYGNEISGTYNGTLNYDNLSVGMSVPSMKTKRSVPFVKKTFDRKIVVSKLHKSH